jgi:CDP-diacylglycerol--serine O-phosphatidyltransferase
MVSNVRYAHVVRHLVRGRRTGRHVITLVFAAAVVALLPELAAPILFCWYTFAAPVRWAWKEFVGPPSAPREPGGS